MAEETMDISSLYGQPVTDYSFLFESNQRNDADGIARMNAALLAVSEVTSNRTKDAGASFMNEYGMLSGHDQRAQDEYVKSKVQFTVSDDLRREMSQILSAANAGFLTPKAESSNTDETTVASNAVLELQERARTIRTRREYISSIVPGAETLPLAGSVLVVDAVNNYRYATTADARAATVRSFYDMLLHTTITAVGGKPGELFSAAMAPAWAQEFIPGKVLYEWGRYGSGLIAMSKFKSVSVEEQMVIAAKTAEELIAAKATPLTVYAVLDRLSPEGNRGLEAVYGSLDLLGLFGSWKAATKIPKHIRRAQVLRKYENAPGVASELGDKVVAGRLSAMVLHSGDPKVEAAVGIDRTTAAMNASPFPWTPLDSTVVDGISAETLKYIEDERKIQNYYLNRAISKDTLATSGFFRPEERAAAQIRMTSQLPAGAEVIEQTPFGMRIRVTNKNAEKFTTPEELSAAEKRYEAWSEGYEQASLELDRFYQETARGKFAPDTTWINRLEAQKARAKQEMETAYDTLTKGIEPDVVDEKFVWYTRDEFTNGFSGVLESTPFLSKYIVSPEILFQPIDPLVVPSRTSIIAKQEQLHKLFKESMYEVLSGLTKKDSTAVAAILRHGDDLSSTFTVKELERGLDVPGVGTVKLDKKGIAGYFKARDLLDVAHGVRSIGKFKRLGFDGYKQATATVEGISRRVFVKDAVISRTLKDGTTSIQLPSDIRKVFDMRPTTGGTVLSIGTELTRKGILDKISAGKVRFVKLEQPIRVGDEALNYAVLYANKIEDLTPDVLPYRKGYLPRIYQDVPYVVRAERTIALDGVTKKNLWDTERFFGTKKEADVWAATKSNEDGIKRVADSDWEWRTKDPSYQKDINEAVFTGLYEDYRGQKILYGTSGEESPRFGAFDSMDKYLSNLSWTYPLNEWRESILQRYFNQVNNFLEVPNDINSPFKQTVSLTESQKNAIINARGYITTQLSLSSDGERIFSRIARQTAQGIEDSFFWNNFKKYVPKGEELTEWVRMELLYGADNYEGYGLLRNAAYRTYLGFFNLSQLVVQASNIAVVFNLHPFNAPSVVRRILAARMVSFLTPSSRGYEKAVQIAAKAALMKYEDFEPMVRALYRSGWLYTVRSNADAAMALRGLSPGGDIKHIGRFVDGALQWPFIEGETWARLYSFIDTYTLMAKKMPDVDLTTPDRINDLIHEATRVSFNYTQANKAYWQRGPLSIPTQFLQTPMKFYEAVLLPTFTSKKIQSQFTRMERFKLLVGQGLLFGTLGVKYIPWLNDAITKMFTEEGSNGQLYPSMSKEQVVALTGGFTDWMAHELSSFVLDSETYPSVSSRVALANGFDLLISNFTSSDPDLGKALLGAVGGVVTQRVYPAIESVVRVHGTQLSMGTMTPKDAVSAFDKLATMTNSWNNYHRARLWENAEAIISKEGTEIVPLDLEKDSGLLRLKKIGIGSYDEYAAFKVKDWNTKKNPTADVRNAVATANLLLLEYSKEGYRTPEGAKLFSDSLAFIRQSLGNEVIRDEFDEAWNDNINNVKSIASKEYLKMIDILLRGDEEELGPVPLEANFLREKVE